MSDDLITQRLPAVTDHARESQSEVPGPAPSMLGAASASFGAAVIQRKLACRLVQRAGNEKDNAKDHAQEKQPEIPLTQDATGQHIAEGMSALNSGSSLDAGLHYSHNYERMCREQKKMDHWKDEYREGFANPKYWKRTEFMAWELIAGNSASVAIKAWLAGLTIAECKSTVRVLQMDAIRASLGDDRFDRLFGPTKGKPDKELLTIGLGQSTVTNYRENVAPADGGKIGDRPAQLGGQYYFTNHPTYLLKHPGGAWQGENALYMGRVNGVQMWSGFGADSVTEDAMLDTMVRKYNEARDANDERRLDAIKRAHGGTLPPEYDLAKLPDITKALLLSAPESNIGNTRRKGGFNAGNGLVVDINAVKGLKK